MPHGEYHGVYLKWNWIADTLAIIEDDLRQRAPQVSRRSAKIKVENALYDVRRAKGLIIEAIGILQSLAPSEVYRVPAETQEDIF